MANSKYYTSKMHSHLKAFFLKKFERLDFEFSDIYNKQYPKRYQSAIHNDKSLFNFIADSLKEGIGSDFSVYRDKDFISYQLKYLNSKNWHNKIILKSYFLDSLYTWHYFMATAIPIKIRELIVDKFNFLEEYYANCIKSHIKRFFIRGHVELFWIQLDSLYKNGFNQYLSQFNLSSPTTPELIISEIINYTEEGIYGMLKDADLYGKYIDIKGNIKNIQLMKFNFKKTGPGSSYGSVRFNTLIYNLNLSPMQYLINKDLLDIYISEEKEPLNLLLESLSLPRIGEGWISETKLFYQIKERFSNEIVMQHWKPKWLGRQHFDIYFPVLNIAVEYQGKQHFEAVDYFGGEESFKQNLVRDKMKKELAKQNNCELIFVEPDYDILDIYTLINSSKNYKKNNIA